MKFPTEEEIKRELKLMVEASSNQAEFALGFYAAIDWLKSLQVKSNEKED